MIEPKAPRFMYLLFEEGLFLGAFESAKAARRLQAAREAAGKPRPLFVKYAYRWASQ